MLVNTSSPTKAKEMTQLTLCGCASATVSTPSAAGLRFSSATCAAQPFSASFAEASATLPAVKGAR